MMRLLLIFCLCGFVWCEEPALNVEESVDSLEPVDVEEVAVEDDFDLGRALEELLIEEDEMVDDVDAIEADKSIAPLADDSQVTPEVTEQFNRLTDVIISKVNVALRTKKLDPLSLNFQKNKKGKKKRKSKKRKSKKRKQKKSKKSKKNRKTRDVTNIEEDDDVMEFEEEEDDAEAVIYSINDEEDDEEDDEEEEDELERVRRDAEDEMEEEEEGEEGARKFNGKRKSSKKSKGKKSKGKKSKGGKKKKSKGKKRKSRKRRKASSIVGVLSGLSTLKRQGDVVVQGEPGNSDIVADFTAGPVNLIAIRKLGKGKKQRRSKATVNTLKGRMVINFSEGSSQISDIILYRPDEIDVDGALSKGKKKQTDAQMMKKVRQVNPIVATKLKQVTRDVLQTIRIQ